MTDSKGLTPLKHALPGLVLIASAFAALLWVNLGSTAYNSYHAIFEFHIAFLSLSEWISEFLLCIFFFLIGIELRHELTHGSLSSLSKAIAPCVSAIFGMLFPAFIYLLFGANANGWAIPTATDIAFAISLLALIAPNISRGARAFLLALAVADDLIAILVIAIFYSESINLINLLLGLCLTALYALILSLSKKYNMAIVYIFSIIIALSVWWLFLQSGVHVTISAVILGILTPKHLTYNITKYLNPISLWVIMPLFALCNSAIKLDFSALTATIQTPEFLGVFFGLILGKPLGILLSCILMSLISRKIYNELKTSGFKNIITVSCLAGIGFTVSILIANLAFAHRAAECQTAILAVLCASIAAIFIAKLINLILKLIK